MGRTTTYAGSQPWIVDPSSITRDNGHQVDWDYVTDAYRTSAFTVQLNGAASATDTDITVDPLPEPLYTGDLLYFGQAGEFARVTANADAGDTTVSVEALPADLEDNDTFVVGRGGDKFIPSGTVMCQLSSGKVVPRAIRPGSETSVGFIETDASENQRSDSLTGYGLVIGGVVYENMLPEASGSPAVINSTYKTELQTAGVGTGFAFKQYSDNRGS